MNSAYRRTPQHALLVATLSIPLSAGAWGQCETELRANNSSSSDLLGAAVAVDGNFALAGSLSSAFLRSYAYVFDLSTGQQTQRLEPTSATGVGGFGAAVALQGTTAVVGAPFEDAFGNDAGGAFVFDVTTGNQLFRLTRSDIEAGDEFGNAVALDGDLALVGSYRDDDLGLDAGAAYLFDVTTGQELLKLQANGGAASDQFGFSVALEGSTALVGAWKAKINKIDSGAAFLFDTVTGTQTARLLPDDPASRDDFGLAVALSGTTALVTATGDDDNGSNSGSAYVFDVTTGQQLFKLLPNDGSLSAAFGSAAALSGTIAIIGASRDSENGLNSGSAYVFDVTTGQQLAKLLPSNGAECNFFGTSVDFKGAAPIVGATGTGDIGTAQGSAYLIVPDSLLDANFVSDLSTGIAPLPVTFTDLSTSASGINAWSWDFGDGATSTEQNPTHVYSSAGSFDVTLTVTSPNFEKSLTIEDALVVLEDARADVYNGSGTNPLIFSSLTDPLVGTTWSSQVDGGSIGSTGGLTFLLGYEAALVPGLPLGLGELLVNPTTPQVAINISFLVAGTAQHDEPIPNDLSLVSRVFAMQVLVNQTPSGQGQLTNALLLTLGNA